MSKTWKTPGGVCWSLYKELLEQSHVMIAGATGSGKSVVENALIYTALYHPPYSCKTPDSVGFIFIDNAKGTEMIDYQGLPHCMRYAHTLEESISALEYGLSIAKERFENMRRRHIKNYDGGHVYIFIDEFASLILNGKKRVSMLTQDLAQLGRAANVHVILCTQCPLAKVIPTEIKVNFDAILGLRTATAQHSRNIVDVTGCELFPDPKTEHKAYGYYRNGVSLNCYEIHMIEQEELDARVKWWVDQNPKGLFSRLFGR